MRPEDKHLITRRSSLALLGSGSAGLLLAGTSGGFGTAFAHTSEGDDHVAHAATLCTLAAEQEEGPFYVKLDEIRENIVDGQTGIPLQLQITIIDASTCKPLKHAAVDLWHCNALGIYSDVSSEKTLGDTYLRGVQFTDKHGQVTFKTIFPGHYAGRTTHIHARVHISSRDSSGKLVGGHIAHTGQMFPPEAVYAEVYKLTPYTSDTATIVDHAEDRVWTGQHGSEFQLKVKQAGSNLHKGLIASVAMAVNPHATPALIGATSSTATEDGEAGTEAEPGGGTPPTGAPDV